MKIAISMIISIIFCLVVAVPAFAVTYEAANQVTANAYPVTTLETGDPIPVDNVITYRWYYDIVDGDVEWVIAGDDTTEPQKIITFAEEGKYHIGIAAVRSINGSEVSISGISSSDDPAVVKNGETWGVLYYSPLSDPVGLHKQ